MMKNENYENHSFSIKLATDLGLESAIILQHLFLWCRANSDNQDMIKDGHIWVYISRKKINSTYPYLKEGKIRGAIDRLQKEGYIKIANYNKLKIDKTNWYGLTDKAYMLFGTSLAILTNGEQKSPTIGENIQAIQDINHDYIETNKKEDTIVSKKKRDVIFSVRADLSYVDDSFRDIWLEWLEYKDEIKKQYKTQKGASRQYKTLINLSDNNPILAYAIVQRSIEHSWDGVFELNDKQKELYLSDKSPYLSDNRESKEKVLKDGDVNEKGEVWSEEQQKWLK